MRKKKLLIIVLSLSILCTSLLSGCWDQRELQERGVALAVGVDVVNEEKGQNTVPSRYEVSVQLLKLTAPGTSEKKNQKEAKTYVLSEKSESIFEAFRKIYSRSSKTIWFEHLQTIVISNKAIEIKGIRPILDMFVRDAEMRWRINVFATKSKAKKILEYIPPTGEPGGIYINKIAKLHTRNPEIPGKRIDLVFSNRLLEARNEIAVPELLMDSGGVKVIGATVFRKDKYVGDVDGYAIKGIKLIRGTVQSVVIPVDYPPGSNTKIIFEVFDMNHKLMPHVEQDELFYTLDIYMRGNIAEKQVSNDVMDTKNPKHIKKLEGLVVEELKQNILYSLNECRRLRFDWLGFSDKLRAHYPKLWKKYEDNWQEVFPKIPLYVRIYPNVQIRGEHL